jgi:HK97 family phage portal protein
MGKLLQSLTQAITPRSKSLSMVPTAPGDRGWLRVFESSAGAWQRGITVDRAAASIYFAAFASETLIARDVAKCRVKLMQRDGDGVWLEVEKEPYSSLLEAPNSYQTRNQLFEYWALSKLRRGNVYVLKVRNGRRDVVELCVLNPDRVTVLVASDGSVFYQCATDELAGLPEQVTVPASEMIHDRFNTLFHPLVGVPPIIAYGLAAAHGLSIQEQSIRLFRNNSQPGGILAAPGEIHDDTAARIKKTWEDNFTGDNAGRVAVVGDNLKYERLGFSAEESELISQLKMTAEVVCSVYHVPPFMVGVGPEPATSSAQERTLRYYTQALQSLMEDAESCLDRGLGLPRNLGVEFDVDNLLRMDSAAQAEMLDKAKGYLTPNEGRKKLGLPKVAGGDDVYRQQQDFSLQALQKRDARDDPFLTGAAVAPPASGKSAPAQIEAGGHPGGGAGPVARPRSTTATIIHVDGALNDAMSEKVVGEIEAVAADQPIEIWINSGGGKFGVAVDICRAIEAHAGIVTTAVVHEACSGAALIAMAGDLRRINLGATIMVHDAKSPDGRSIAEGGSALCAEAISEYSTHRWTVDVVREWMRQESTWDAEGAVRAGFVDFIHDPSRPPVDLAAPAKRPLSKWLADFRRIERQILEWEKEARA